MEDQSSKPVISDTEADIKEDKTTPLRCFISSIFAGVMAYGAYSLLNSITLTYGSKAITTTNPLVFNITTAVRTLVMGIVALATFVFALATLGLFLLGIQLAIQKFKQA
ncbi:MAG: DUF3082 domain-containing protein [Cyanobacteria bacterium J06558_2]